MFFNYIMIMCILHSTRVSTRDGQQLRSLLIWHPPHTSLIASAVNPQGARGGGHYRVNPSTPETRWQSGQEASSAPKGLTLNLCVCGCVRACVCACCVCDAHAPTHAHNTRTHSTGNRMSLCAREMGSASPPASALPSCIARCCVFGVNPK